MDPISIIGYIALVVGSILALFSRLPKQTISEQKKLIEALTGRIEQLEHDRKEDAKNHVENLKAIADLQGQIKVYKEIPLNDIATAMKEMNNANRDIAMSNKLILETLQRSAVIAADDRDVPVQTTEEIVTQKTTTKKR